MSENQRPNSPQQAEQSPRKGKEPTPAFPKLIEILDTYNEDPSELLDSTSLNRDNKFRKTTFHKVNLGFAKAIDITHEITDPDIIKSCRSYMAWCTGDFRDQELVTKDDVKRLNLALKRALGRPLENDEKPVDPK